MCQEPWKNSDYVDFFKVNRDTEGTTDPDVEPVDPTPEPVDPTPEPPVVEEPWMIAER